MNEAGRELDALIAEKVMGLLPICVDDEMSVFTIRRQFLEVGDYWYVGDGGVHEVPHYSTDIAAAWRVVEKMRNPDFRLNREGDWVCCFGSTIAFCGDAPAAPLAICRAALKAIGES